MTNASNQNLQLNDFLSAFSNITIANSTYLPPFIDDGYLPVHVEYPWGNATEQRTWADAPDTGIIRAYNFTITRGVIAPDGFSKSVLLVNNEFPGPLLEANWGDTFEITINNQIANPEEGTMLHWHGLYQHQTPWYDGVPAVDMCPIAPGRSFTYTFKADQYGTSWWHSHYDAQYADGLFGPMVIYGPKTTIYDIDIGTVLLGVYYHKDYHYYVQQTSGIPFELPLSDNNLINGKNAILSNCSTSSNATSCVDYSKMETFQFQPNKVHRLRLINAGADGIQRFAIDGHKMTIIANDFVPVVPYESDIISLGVGQRTDILVNASAGPGSSWWMRSNLTMPPCGIGNQPYALAAIYYTEADKSTAPTSTPDPSTYNSTFCQNNPLSSSIPLFSTTPPSSPAVTQQIEVLLGQNSSGNSLFFMNGESFRGNYNNPVMLLAAAGNTSYPDDPEWNVYNFGSNSSVRIVLINNTTLTHPIHMHGHNFWVLAEGVGQWDGTVENAENPQRRDIQLLQGSNGDELGYLVLEFIQDNPGVWPLHCHIAWHVSTGFYINVMEHPEEIANFTIPNNIMQTCRDWANYTGQNIVDQIDSGL
ncbi:oxidoreductase [Lachnellula subtilissima]|uniref:Oxidoreductase n=1 Tax=Lachnellula subtilissima TaxID=602034 RepID=A0A8H8UHS1_9HELO|nr:oxidoreductase [Lachnellula subtilissima]